MKNLFKFLLLISLLLPSYAFCAGLKDYKKQKHETRERVDSESCQPAYIKDCQSKCNPGDEACSSQCSTNAPSFCEQRDKRKFWKTVEVVGKGASVAAGALGVVLDKDMETVGPEGSEKIGPYSIIWNSASLESNLGMGLIEAGGKALTFNPIFRYGAWGFAANGAYLWDKEEHLVETDFGPTFSMASSSFIFTLQPSVLTSGGNDVKTEFGAPAFVLILSLCRVNFFYMATLCLAT